MKKSGTETEQDDQIKGQITIGQYLEALQWDPLEAYALWGSGINGWNVRIRNYFLMHCDIKDRERFLREEYGIGGFRSPERAPCYIHSIEHDGRGSRIEYTDAGGQIRERHISYSELAEAVGRLIEEGRY